MERLGDILKKIKTSKNSSEQNIGEWLSDDKDDYENIGTPCDLCHGARFVHPLFPSGQPDYRKVVPCKCVLKEVEKGRNEKLQKYSNLGSLSRVTFDKLSPEGRKSEGKCLFEYKPVFDAALAFAEKPRGWLIIVGPNGSGKTQLACSIANYRISKSQPAFYIDAADLLDHLRSTYHPESNVTYDELFEQIRNTPLLILDNLNISSVTPWAKEKLQQILNYRFNQSLPMVITTSVSVEELENNLQCHLNDPDQCKICIIEKVSEGEIERYGGLDLELIKRMSFSNFNYKLMDLPERQRLSLEYAYKRSYNFAHDPMLWLVLQGPIGCGKTHLAASIANYLHSSGKPVLFIVVPDFMEDLRSAIGNNQVSYDALFEKVKKASILILDDFGGQAITPWTQDKLYQLINYRYNAKLPTVITTSFELEDIEDRFSSRMEDVKVSAVIKIEAPDYRSNKKSNDKRSSSRYKKTLP